MIKVYENHERKEFLQALQDIREETGDLLYTGHIHMTAVTGAAKANNGKFRVFVSDEYIFAEQSPAGEMFMVHFVDMPVQDIIMRQTRQEAEMAAAAEGQPYEI